MRSARSAATRSAATQISDDPTDAVSETVERLMSAAKEEFIAKGYEGASIEGVARRAGAGKMTVYRHFRDKHALFHGLVLRSTKRIQVELDFLQSDTRPPEVALLEAARRIQHVSAMTANLDLLRIVIGESQRFPQLAHELLAVHEASTRPLEDYLQKLMQSGALVRHDADALARMFFRMAVESYRGLMGAMDERSSRRSHAALQRTCVDVFLKGLVKRPRRVGARARRGKP